MRTLQVAALAARRCTPPPPFHPPAVAEEKLLQRSFIDASDVEEVVPCVCLDLFVAVQDGAVHFSLTRVGSLTKMALRSWAGRTHRLARALCCTASYPLPHLSPQLRRHHRRRLQAQEAVTNSCWPPRARQHPSSRCGLAESCSAASLHTSITSTGECAALGCVRKRHDEQRASAMLLRKAKFYYP